MATVPVSTSSETGILDRLLDLGKTPLSIAGARSLLTLEFSQHDRARMHELAVKSQEDTLTDDESRELDSYRRIGLLLSSLKSKARMRLKATSGKRTKNGHRR